MFSKKSKTNLLVQLIANLTAALLLAGGAIALELMNSPLTDNKKALFALSFIPFALGMYALASLFLLKKHPEKMKPVVLSENDERLAAFRDKADAITFRFIKWALLLIFFGYTFIVPADIFETAAWWIVFGLFFVSNVLSPVILSVYLRNDNKIDKD